MPPPLTIGTGKTLLGNRRRYVLLDRFFADQAAPLTTPRPCEPGPGALTVNQPSNMSVSNGRLVATTGVADKGVISVSSYPHIPGRAYGVTIVSITNRLDVWVGASGTQHNFEIINGTASLFVRIATAARNTGPHTTSYPLAVWFVRRASGGLFYIIGGKLRWIHNGPDVVAWPTRLNSSSTTSAFTVGDLRIIDFGGVWTSDYGIATNRVVSPISGDISVSMADAVVEFTWTPANAETLELDVRRTNNDNRWIVRCDQAGGTIKLIERNAGVETERDSDAQTWTVGTQYRIVVAMEGADIRNFVNDGPQNAYTSASFNQTATGVQVSGFATGSNLVCWPRDVSALIPIGV